MRPTAAIGLLGLALSLSACSGAQPAPDAPAGALDMTWTSVDSLEERLPAGVRVLAGVSESLPLRAWAVRVASGVPLDVVQAEGEDRREQPSDMAERTGACVVLNGGYFDMATGAPVGAFSDADDPGGLASSLGATVARDEIDYPLVRGAFGITTAGEPDIAWTAACSGPCRVEQPPNHTPGQPDASASPRQQAVPWAVREYLSAGPMLMRDGDLHVTADEEVFFGTSIPETHPRSAIGITPAGGAILLVVDGRQRDSRGATLDELAMLMRDLGAASALNLDGGGSSAMVAAGVRLNLPTGYDVERPVANAVAVRCPE